MVDGDSDAPLGSFSFDTRKGAFRKMVSGLTRRALEEFIKDIRPLGCLKRQGFVAGGQEEKRNAEKDEMVR